MVLRTAPNTERAGAARPGAARPGAALLRAVFFGTPAFAVPTLRALAGDERFDVALVVSQPDRPAGRGRRLEAPPVKRAAEDLGLPVYQPATLKDEAARAPLVELDADLFVVAAFGLIFGRRTLAIPRLGCINVHASLLPRYRGASPVAAAILAGDNATGVSLMLMDVGLDTGPVIAQQAVAIEPDDTTASLTERLANVGASLIGESLPAYAAGDLAPRPQPREGASVTRPLAKADGWLDWSAPAPSLERRVRAMWPWPRAWTTLGDEPLQVHRATVVAGAAAQPPGTEAADGGLVVACGEGALRLEIVQPAGRRPMSGAAFLAGPRVVPGGRFGETGAPPAQPPLVTVVEADGRS